MRQRRMLLLLLLLLLSSPLVAGLPIPPLPGMPPGSATLYGGDAEATFDLAQAGEELMQQLDADSGVYHANLTIWTSHASSLHLFATNRTEPCHFHPGTTLATTLAGHGAFRVPYGSPQLQGAGDSFFIPIGQPHAFGPAQPESGPVLVSVLWTPPYHSGYTVPTTGCRMKHDEAEVAPANNRQPLLIPKTGAWRGAEIGNQFAAPGGGTDGKLARFRQAYPSTPLHVYRTFNTTVGPDIKAWVRDGGILWYNIKSGKSMSWEKAASGSYDQEARTVWAPSVKSLAPALVYVVVYHEPDHNVCFTAPCLKGGLPGNTPANYRNMVSRVQSIFKAQQVINAVWVMDFSVQIANSADIGTGCTVSRCEPAGAVPSLWPGDDRIDWVFFNIFEKGKKHGTVKADYASMIHASMSALNVTTADKHCHCVPSRDTNCNGAHYSTVELYSTVASPISCCSQHASDC
jgi:hypothetical protein